MTAITDKCICQQPKLLLIIHYVCPTFMYAMLLCSYIFVMFDWIILTVHQSGDNPDSVPMPIVLIDQESNCEETIV